MPGAVKRTYDSPLRRAHAASTRLAILQAAGRLFSERGYVGTSIDAIAAAAGVGRATVFTSVGGKPVLLKAAYDVALVGDDAPVALPDRPDSRAVRAEPDPRRYLDGYAGIAAGVSERIARIHEAVRGAASADPEVRAVWERVQAERQRGASHVVEDVLSRASLRGGLDRDAAADVVFVLIDPGLYGLLVHARGWSHERYRDWLSWSLRSQLLGDPG